MNPMEKVWLAIGFLGQAIFGSRFLIQWIASERAKQSIIPLAFWWLSLVGAVFLLIYSIHRMDPVFIVGQCTGFFIYSRNLYFIYTKKSRQPIGRGTDPDNASGT
jgi:lipid-A-disaccharide synthase-like uncharacterized protein